MIKKQKRKILSIRVPIDIYKKSVKMAKIRGMSLNQFICFVLNN